MFIAFIQFIDLIFLGKFNLFLLFFICSWTFFLIRIIKSRSYKARSFDYSPISKIYVVIPVVDEDITTFNATLSSAKASLKDFSHEIVVVANGNYSQENARQATLYDTTLLTLSTASKRKALRLAADYISKKGYEEDSVTLILDSDTIMPAQSAGIGFINFLSVFSDPKVGGATPKQIIFNTTNIWRRISDWLEDIRFSEILKGQNEYVSCLPGRLLAVRTELFIKIAPKMATQTFLGAECISGDDRFLTSELLKMGYKTIYSDVYTVLTDSPNTFKGFVKQRLRWSRTSCRETLRSIGWLEKYKYTAFTVYYTFIMRWFFFVVICTFLFKLITGNLDQHFIQIDTFMILIGSVLGFLVNGTLKQLRHLIKNPSDVVLLIPFLFITTFVLTPIEWFGNLTLKESGWMTRKVK